VVLACATSAQAQVRTTTWTRAGGNDLWDDSRNWSNGVPDAGTVASFAVPEGANTIIDLGGATRRAARVSVFGFQSTTRFINGTLSTPLVRGGSNVIDGTLTTDGPLLRLEGWLTHSGAIVGSMDVEAAAAYTG